MTIQPQPMSEQEHRAIISICILAAFADGSQSETERAQIQRILDGFADPGLDLGSAYQNVLAGKVTLADAAGQLQSPAAKNLAYEMAACLCRADGDLLDPEKKFLSDLRQALQLDTASTDAQISSIPSCVATVEPPPVIGKSGLDEEIDNMILKAAILNGALEIMPHSMATMAIIPLQTRLVYQIGSRYGYKLDSGHIKEFLATVGVGLTSQVFEGFTRRLVGEFAHHWAGGIIGGLVQEATGSAVGFASTYALGQVARKYYASGRTLSAGQLKDTFASMLQTGRSMQGRYMNDIQQQARQVNMRDLIPLAQHL